MGTRESFVEKFGEEAAVAIESAAHEHKNGIHDKYGSDPFRWAIAICIGYQCFEVESYRKHHKIKPSYADIERWIIDEGKLGEHDGDVDYISLMAGSYDRYVKKAVES